MQTRFASGTGEMAAAMRSFDWSTTAIGSPENWPRPLRTLVGLMLTAKQAMFMAWGPERLMLYNDAYAELLGNKHPCLGLRFEDVWSDIWTDIEPLVEQVFAGERCTWTTSRCSSTETAAQMPVSTLRHAAILKRRTETFSHRNRGRRRLVQHRLDKPNLGSRRP